MCHIITFYRSKCKYCGKIYTKRGWPYLNHIRKCEREIIKIRTDEYKENGSYKSWKCSTIFQDRKTLYIHYTSNHQKGRGDVLQSLLWGQTPAPWENENGDIIDPALKQVYEAHISIYLESHRIGDIQSTYNFPIQNNLPLADIRHHLNHIYNTQTQSFKLNVMFGLILKVFSIPQAALHWQGESLFGNRIPNIMYVVLIKKKKKRFTGRQKRQSIYVLQSQYLVNCFLWRQQAYRRRGAWNDGFCREWYKLSIGIF